MFSIGRLGCGKTLQVCGLKYKIGKNKADGKCKNPIDLKCEGPKPRELLSLEFFDGSSWKSVQDDDWYWVSSHVFTYERDVHRIPDKMFRNFSTVPTTIREELLQELKSKPEVMPPPEMKDVDFEATGFMTEFEKI